MTPLHCESSLLNSVFCSFCAFVCDPEKDKEDQAVTGDNGQSPPDGVLYDTFRMASVPELFEHSSVLMA